MTRTLTVTWKTEKAARLQLEALDAGNCQKYDLRCDPTSSAK
jgi:hypothetical protein